MMMMILRYILLRCRYAKHSGRADGRVKVVGNVSGRVGGGGRSLDNVLGPTDAGGMVVGNALR